MALTNRKNAANKKITLILDSYDKISPRAKHDIVKCKSALLS